MKYIKQEHARLGSDLADLGKLGEIMPFWHGRHAEVIRVIAQGLSDSGHLNNYLEIGVNRGHTFNRVAPLAVRAIAVDIGAWVYEKIKRNKNLVWSCGNLKTFLTGCDQDFKVDMVFIDGDHSHDASLDDFDRILPYVREHGLILLHDTHPCDSRFAIKGSCWEVYKTAWHIRQHLNDLYKGYEIMTLPFYHGISIVRKAEQQLSW